MGYVRSSEIRIGRINLRKGPRYDGVDCLTIHTSRQEGDLLTRFCVVADEWVALTSAPTAATYPPGRPLRRVEVALPDCSHGHLGAFTCSWHGQAL